MPDQANHDNPAPFMVDKGKVYGASEPDCKQILTDAGAVKKIIEGLGVVHRIQSDENPKN